MKFGKPETAQRITETINHWGDERVIQRVIEFIWSRCLDAFMKMKKADVVERIKQLICDRDWPICGWLDGRFAKRMSNGIMIPARHHERGLAVERIINSICDWLDERAEALRLAVERDFVVVRQIDTRPRADGRQKNNVIRISDPSKSQRDSDEDEDMPLKMAA